jgi:hypothetical protein
LPAHAKLELREMKDVAFVEQRAVHALAVDEGAVGAVEVAEPELLTLAVESPRAAWKRTGKAG